MTRRNRVIARWWGVALLSGCLGACGWRGSVAARAGEQVLTAERLAEIVSRWRGASADTSLARQVANWWVEYQIFAHRTASGDSLLDSATVREVLWPTARAYVLARWREQLFASQLPLDSAALDSVYRAGDFRLIQHVLFQVPGRGPAELRQRVRRRAEALRLRLDRGLSWEAAQRENEDPISRSRGGNVGVITRGQTEPEFEEAAFGLAPGGISPVVASSHGFHIARRPPLREVREDFRAAVEPLVAQRLDSLHMRELAQERRLALTPSGLERARAAVREPLRFKSSRTVIATFDGGRFTLADLVRWLQAVPDWMHIQVERGVEQGSGRPLSGFLDQMMGYELLYREALDHHVDLLPEEFSELREELAQQLNKVRAALGVYPPAPGDSTGSLALQRRAAGRVEQYLDALPGDWQRFARVPSLLADRLKEESRWAVYPRGIRRSVRRVAEVRALQDSASR